MGDLVIPGVGTTGWNAVVDALIAWYNAHGDELPARVGTLEASAMTSAEKAKLAGMAAGATANSTDAQLRDRGTHTGTQAAASISDLTEAVQDIVAAFLVAGTNVTLTHNDAGNTLTVAAAGGAGGAGLDAEGVRDTIGTALLGSGLISVTVNDAGDTITVSTTATANSTDAQLRDRGTHTGTQAVSTVTGLQTALDGKVGLATVDFRGDLIVGTGPDAVARLASGADGTALIAQASAAQGLAYLGVPVYVMPDTYTTANLSAALAAVPAGVPAGMLVAVKVDGS